MASFPAWVETIGLSDFEAYRDAVERASRALGLGIRFDWDAGNARITGDWSMSLISLAQRWATTPPADRDALLAEYFVKVSTFDPDAALEVADRDDLLARLRTRIYAGEVLEDVWREYAGMYREAVVLDSPQFLTATIRSLLDQYEVTVDEAFERGMANVRALGPPEVMIEEFEPGIHLRVIVSPHDIVSAWLPWIGELVPVPDHGMLVATPTQQALYVLTYPADRSVDALQWLARFSWKTYHDGPSAITPSLLFVHPDRLDPIYVLEEETGEFVISPPNSAMPWFGG
ncbi:MAG TPA: hypothetical protein PLH94_13255 [Fimbriimonadaceae bacterium]|nr:hypothetical protein [Fimbriimonadaceae bacterium]